MSLSTIERPDEAPRRSIGRRPLAGTGGAAGSAERRRYPSSHDCDWARRMSQLARRLGPTGTRPAIPLSILPIYTQAVSQDSRRSPLFVVGIGASAGGLEALGELLGALPATGMAFIVVQHLDPTHESLLPEILAKKTTMAVSLASAGEAVQPDHVYVIPPDALLTVHEGLIEVKRRTSAPERPFPVDLLFSSLAVTYGEGAIGVVLSGADADGSLGLREIKHAGGFTFAQQPESARFPTMPRHAIETGCVDLVLRPKEIAGELARLSRRFRTAEPAPNRNRKARLTSIRRRECGPGSNLPEASRGARRGLHPLQANHDQAPHRAAHDAATDREPRRVPRIARSRSRRARRAVPGLPDPGHRVLS